MTGLGRRLSQVREQSSSVAQAGLGLAELLVTVMIFSMLSMLLVGLVSSVSNAFSKDRSATDSTQIAAIGMNELTRVIRSGTTIRVSNQPLNDPVFLVATPETLVLRAFLDTSSATPAPVVVRFEIGSTRLLTEQRWPADAASGPNWTFTNLPAAPYQVASTYWTGPATTRTVSRLITPLATSGVSTFRYYDDDALELVPGAGVSLTAAQIAAVGSVTVTLSVQADLTAQANPVVLQNSVGIPNLGISRVGL